MEDDKKEGLSAQDAKAVIENERKKRIELCAREVQGVLEKHRCSLSVAMIVTQQGNVPRVDILAANE